MKLTREPITVSEFLLTRKGRLVCKRIKDKIQHYAELPCGDNKGLAAWKYLLYSEAYVALSEKLPNSSFYDFDVDSSIQKAKVDEIVGSIEAWTDSDYCGDILGKDDDAYMEEVKAMFDYFRIDENGESIFD